MVRRGINLLIVTTLVVVRLIGPALVTGAAVPPSAGRSPMPSRAATMTAVGSI